MNIRVSIILHNCSGFYFSFSLPALLFFRCIYMYHAFYLAYVFARCWQFYYIDTYDYSHERHAEWYAVTLCVCVFVFVMCVLMQFNNAKNDVVGHKNVYIDMAANSGENGKNRKKKHTHTLKTFEGEKKWGWDFLSEERENNHIMTISSQP